MQAGSTSRHRHGHRERGCGRGQAGALASAIARLPRSPSSRAHAAGPTADGPRLGMPHAGRNRTQAPWRAGRRVR
eukprot:38457-Chlamydomonas_euryale.AAC.6